MSTLHWIGKDKVVNHHFDFSSRILNHKHGFTDEGEIPPPLPAAAIRLFTATTSKIYSRGSAVQILHSLREK